MKIDISVLDKKRDELNRLVEKDPNNLCSEEIIKVSHELDNPISTYLFSQTTNRKFGL